jgi:hypothetical protein
MLNYLFLENFKKLNFAAFAFPPKVFFHNSRENVQQTLGNPCKKVKFKKNSPIRMLTQIGLILYSTYMYHP